MTEEVLPGDRTATFDGKLYAAPFTSNTQLLWYRKDLVRQPPKTWDEMIEQAEKIGEARPDPGPGQPLRGLHRLGQLDDRVRRHADPLRPGKGRPRTGPDGEGAGGDGPARQLLGRAPRPLHLRRGHRPALLRGRRIGLHAQLPLRLRQRQGERARRRQGDGHAASPGSTRACRASRRSAASTSRISSYSENKDVASTPPPAWPASRPAHRGRARRPAPDPLRPLHGQGRIKAYPGFSGLVKESIENAGPRPTTPAYQDLSLGPPARPAPAGEIDPEDPAPVYDELKSRPRQAVKREGLL